MRRTVPISLLLSAGLAAQVPSVDRMLQRSMHQNMAMQQQMSVMHQMHSQVAAARARALRNRTISAVKASEALQQEPFAMPPTVLKWQHPLPEWRFLPCLEDGRVLSFNSVTEVPFGRKHEVTTEFIRCLDAESGKTTWEHRVEGEVETWPLFFGNLAVYGSKSYQIVALDSASGAEKFRIQLEALKPFLSRPDITKVHLPILEGERLYVAIHGKGSTGDGIGHLYSIDTQNGKKIWDCLLEAGAANPPLVHEDLLLIGGGSWITGIHARNGEVAWRTWTGGKEVSDPGMILGGKLLMKAGPELLALDPSTGKLLWRSPQPGFSPIQGDEQNLIFLEQRLFGSTWAVGVDTGTGKQAWEVKVGSGWEVWWSMGGTAFISKGNEAKGIALKDGKTQWSVTLPGKVGLNPWPQGDLMLIVAEEKKKATLHALRFKDGTSAWTFPVPIRLGEGSLAVYPEGIFVPSKDKNLVFLK